MPFFIVSPRIIIVLLLYQNLDTFQNFCLTFSQKKNEFFTSHSLFFP